ncbi:MAG: hypothetical protein IJ258_07720 [Methanobrevibacter sp.]|uniref:hypothetical protein n=1 Tax=Methanobrevibacter sp. TaxID=66852 RepID=UPI0025F35C33|nr:hypothetical protein [Methanobrevibacter sp.]MBQ8017978.1 hypothetical protein [Methanobrevibacter sp.]
MVHAFVPQHIIDLAEYLKAKEFSDKNYDLQCIDRTIVNRAYLSTYLHAQEWIINNGPYNDIKDYSKKDVGYHTAICIALTALNKKAISKKYADFIKLRVDADYDIITIIDSDDAKKALDLASQIQTALQ